MSLCLGIDQMNQIQHHYVCDLHGYYCSLRYHRYQNAYAFCVFSLIIIRLLSVYIVILVLLVGMFGPYQS